ncbi:hypothetical protein EDD21DRAFT_400856 [Dissophora ornata]|nr:hypothetical protein BGZ58_001472 [Dissophora ornata]KAI8605913.1 hypothetical protein EDD21DRAFT_400856 [Dissophora ornata]
MNCNCCSAGPQLPHSDSQPIFSFAEGYSSAAEHSSLGFYGCSTSGDFGDKWVQFLQNQYNPKHPHRSSQRMCRNSTAPTGRFSTPFSAAFGNGCNSQFNQKIDSQMLSDDDREYLRPRLSQAAAAHAEAAAARARERTSSLVEANVNLSMLPRRTLERTLSICSSTSSSSTSSSWSTWSSDNETEMDVDQRLSVYIHKKKTLPPPTLSPILVPSAPKRSPRRTISSSNLSMCSWSDDSSSSSGGSCYSSCGGSDSEDEIMMDAWPTMENITFSRRQQSDLLDSDDDDHSHQKKFVSELPLPPSLLSFYDNDDNYNGDGLIPSRKYLALSASIWGPGWHQVEPLPASFVKTMEETELEAQAQALALAQEKAAQAATNPKTRAKKAKQQAKAKAAAAAAALAQDAQGLTGTSSTTTTTTNACNPQGSIVNTLSSARLPRSLQFVD